MGTKNVKRDMMVEAFDRFARKFGEATEREIDARVKAAFEAHNRARHRTLRQRFADFLVRARS